MNQSLGAGTDSAGTEPPVLNPRRRDESTRERLEIPSYAFDEQTGRWYAIRPEEKEDTLAARISAIYLIVAAVFLIWLLFDFWIGEFTPMRLLGYDTAELDSPLFRLLAYAAISGGLGGALAGMRNVLHWHSEREAFGRRYIWKAFTFPLHGAILAVIVYVVLRTGIGALNGDFSIQDTELATLSSFGLGGLIGYGSQKVFVWLGAQVDRLFHVDVRTIAPQLVGSSLSEAVKASEEARVAIVGVTEESDAPEGIVIRQSPEAGTTLTDSKSIAVVVAKKRASNSPGGNGHIPPADDQASAN